MEIEKAKVDEYHELKKKIQTCIDVRQISGDPNNDLMELRNMIELFTIKRLDNEKALREGIKELQNKNPYKKTGNRDSYSQYNEGWQDALDYVEQLITY